VELDRAVARTDGTAPQGVLPPLPDRAYAADELEILENDSMDLEWPWFVHANLRALGPDLTAALAAGGHADWAAMLRTVRQIQARAVVTRGLLERMLGYDADATEPPLVRLFREAHALISDGEIDSLPADELRIRLRKVLQSLDRELKALLSPPDPPPGPKDFDDDQQTWS
jgi:hypothetical protein